MHGDLSRLTVGPVVTSTTVFLINLFIPSNDSDSSSNVCIVVSSINMIAFIVQKTIGKKNSCLRIT